MGPLHGSLAILALVASAPMAAPAVITSDAAFYGQSPPVYPSPNATGTGAWAAAHTKARALVGQMTLDEKVSLTAGVYVPGSACSGIIPAIPRLGFPGLCLSDAGNGLRSTDFVSSWPSGISVGASWNRSLTNARAVGMAGEFRRKGVNVALGPVVGPLGRIATGGRNWEGFSNDPYLCGALAYETVTGFQSMGVATSTKHFIGNEQETNRNPEGNVSAVSSNIDDKTLHELYLWPFQDAVRAGTGNIMCSYNRVNNSYACGNSKLLNGILKTELGFQGFVVSDWGAQHGGYATALAGLDMAMPTGFPFWGSYLAEAVTNGSVPLARLDDMATRIVANWYQMNQNATGAESFPAPGVGMPANIAAPHAAVDGRDHTAATRATLLTGAVEGHVLVKNVNGTLPFSSSSPPRLISVFGYAAKVPDVFSPNDGRGWSDGSYPLETGNKGHPQIAGAGILVSGGGSGANQPAYISSPLDALRARARRDGHTSIYWDVRNANHGDAAYPSAVDPMSDACIVAGNAYASEGWDRVGLHDDYTDGLILHVAARCRSTIVVLYNAGLRLVEQFVDHPNVTALLFAHLPGQDAGDALVDLLYGDASPSGKLPYTVPRNETQLGALANATHQPPATDEYALFPQSTFGEGVYIDYRAADLARSEANATMKRMNTTGVTVLEPRFPFGFGLSYTTFGFSGLAVAKAAPANTSSALFAPYPSGPVVEGGPADLWHTLVTVTAHITNTGIRAGAEVAQLYVGIPGGPVRQLRGFDKVWLEPGEAAAVSFALTRRDLSVWDVPAQKWLLQTGADATYRLYVGSSSRDLPQQMVLTL